MSEEEIRMRWYCMINKQLTINKVTAMKIKRNSTFMKLIEETWGPTLRKEKELQANWIHSSEVLVGRTV